MENLAKAQMAPPPLYDAEASCPQLTSQGQRRVGKNRSLALEVCLDLLQIAPRDLEQCANLPGG